MQTLWIFLKNEIDRYKRRWQAAKHDAFMEKMVTIQPMATSSPEALAELDQELNRVEEELEQEADNVVDEAQELNRKATLCIGIADKIVRSSTRGGRQPSMDILVENIASCLMYIPESELKKMQNLIGNTNQSAPLSESKAEGVGRYTIAKDAIKKS